MVRYRVASAILTLGLVSGAANGADTNGAWRMGKALDLPGWLSIDGTYRVRYESLDSPFRAKARGSDQIMVERLLLNARVTFDRLYGDIELEDARQQLAESGTPLGTDIVNTLEPLQAYLGARFSGVFSGSDRLDLTAGRMTMDVGSRRLVARNRFRNTTNAFTGMRAKWQRSDGSEAQAFYVLPVQRRPSDFASLKNNDSEIDTETSGAQLWGLFGARPNILGTATGEAYFYGFRARDRPYLPVADRTLYTPGVRLFVKPAATSWDYEVESAFQFGTSRLTTAATDKKNLQQRAGFFHVAAGYTLSGSMSPRLELSYDFASGDRDPKDGTDNRFDPLFGARRFDLGPTGIYGALARSNISSPGMRIEAKPTRDLSGFAGYRALWLASGKDQFTTARLQDPTGRSGRFVGHQIEAEMQYNLVPGNLALQIGGAYLIQGRFLENAPNAPREGNTTYVYASAMATF